ncbi:DUF551 domain-containing protein [Salmonella enterica subsp. enterica]|nr:DUF551 domain-containing protein [Salmonella enterica subsp. enterica serovar Malstatt]
MTNDKITDKRIGQLASIFAPQDSDPVRRDIRLALCELRELRKLLRWIPIDEELPEDESTVIVKNIDGVQWVADFSDDCFYPDEFPVYKMGGDEVTHWMSFPE